MNKNAVVMGLLFLMVFVVGFALGRMTEGTSVNLKSITQNERTADSSSNAQTENTGEATTVNTSGMTDGQRKMLESMGIDADNVTITAEMIACAEAKLGSARVGEIKNGATPSFTEGASLMACYR